MFDSDDENPSPGYWPSVSDLFMTLFIISIAILAAVFFALLPKNNVAADREVIVAVGQDLRKIREPINRLRTLLELPLIRETQTPNEVVTALQETCDTAIERITSLEQRIEKLRELDAAREELAKLQEENRSLKEQVARLKLQLKELQKLNRKDLIAENKKLKRQLHDKPPNIQINEQKEEYRFESGSSLMGPAFIAGLTENEFKRLADEIVAREEKGRVKVNTLEIIGHTDGVPFARQGNLDQKLPEVLAGSLSGISSLTPGSNNDLGLLRALAVREQWERFTSEHDHPAILQKIEIRCYSAGQTILPVADEHPEAKDFRQPDPRARRIEMRLTRLGDL